MAETEHVLDALGSLRATRWFDPRPVPDDVLTRVLDTARWTGSARNRQPWRFVVLREVADCARLSCLGAYAGHLAGAPVVVALGVDASTADAEFDAGRLAQTLMLAAHAIGLGSCPATFFPDANVAAATELTGLAAPWRVRTAIALGYPGDAPEAATRGTRAIPAGRLPLTELRRTVD